MIIRYIWWRMNCVVLEERAWYRGRQFAQGGAFFEAGMVLAGGDMLHGQIQHRMPLCSKRFLYPLQEFPLSSILQRVT